MPLDLDDPELREELAMSAYYRDRASAAAVDAEHHTKPDTAYVCLSWDSLSTATQRPYRTGVAEACDMFLRCDALRRFQ